MEIEMGQAEVADARARVCVYTHIHMYIHIYSVFTKDWNFQSKNYTYNSGSATDLQQQIWFDCQDGFYYKFTQVLVS